MNTFNVVVLGASNSGKTVYLASMFHKLSIPGASGYFLDAPLEHQKHLTTAFSTVLRSGWLGNNAWNSIHAYDFTVMIQSPGGANHPAVTLRYYDMAGGRQTSVNNDASIDKEIAQETAEVINKADILLALIDGQRLHDYLQKEVIDSDFWFSHMHSLCAELAKHNARDKSLHFLLTKWDLFNDTDAALEEAATALLTHEPFRKLVENCTGRVRLIPISAVGAACAKKLNDIRKARQEDDTAPLVLKRSDLPRPINVEIPFACILPDILERHATELNDADEAKARTLGRPVDPNISWWEKLLGNLGNTVAVFADNRGHWFGAELLRQAAKTARRFAYDKCRRAAEVQAENEAAAQQLRAAVKDRASAVKYTLEIMMQAENEFLNKYPSSDLKSFTQGLERQRP